MFNKAIKSHYFLGLLLIAFTCIIQIKDAQQGKQKYKTKYVTWVKKYK